MRHPAAFALSRTAVARGMMMPIWMVLDASSRFRNRFMLNSLKMAEHRGTIKNRVGVFGSRVQALGNSPK